MTIDLLPHPSTVHGAVSSSLEPVLWIEPGERVVVKTVDVGFGVEPPTDAVSPRTKVLPSRMEVANGPGCVGPIGVRGAQPGTVLAVTLHRLVPSDWGFTYLGGGFPNALADALGIGDAEAGVVRWSIDVDAGLVHSDLGWSVALRPFMGTIGVAPATSEVVPGWAPRATGGNMDCKELVTGSTIYFPIEAEGALLSLGDGHAAQGNGEVGGMAIECVMEEVELSVELLDAAPTGIVGYVSAETPSGAVAFGFAEALDDAMTLAVRNMSACLEQRCSVSPTEALVLASAAVDFHGTQVVNGMRGVHGVLGRGALVRT